MATPTADLLKWLTTQDPEVLSDIAGLIPYAHPGFDNQKMPVELNERIAEFIRVIGEHGEGSMKDVGFLLAFRVIFDFMFNSRSTAEGWERPKQLWQKLLNGPEDAATPNMRASAKIFLDALPSKISLWVNLYKEWEGLKNSSLSDANLQEWQEQSFIARPRTPHIVQGVAVKP